VELISYIDLLKSVMDLMRRMRWAEHVAHGSRAIHTGRVLVEEPEENSPLERSGCR
jgi:hypothetical protein